MLKNPFSFTYIFWGIFLYFVWPKQEEDRNTVILALLFIDISLWPELSSTRCFRIQCGGGVVVAGQRLFFLMFWCQQFLSTIQTKEQIISFSFSLSVWLIKSYLMYMLLSKTQSKICLRETIQSPLWAYKHCLTLSWQSLCLLHYLTFQSWSPCFVGWTNAGHALPRVPLYNPSVHV